MEAAKPYLSKVSIFEDLSDGEITKIAQRFTFVKYHQGQPIFYSGDSGNNFFIIKEGLVKVSNMNPNGKVIILAILGPNDFFGEMALFDDSPRSAGVESFPIPKLLSFPKLIFKVYCGRCRRYPGKCYRFFPNVFGKPTNNWKG